MYIESEAKQYPEGLKGGEGRIGKRSGAPLKKGENKFWKCKKAFYFCNPLRKEEGELKSECRTLERQKRAENYFKINFARVKKVSTFAARRKANEIRQRPDGKNEKKDKGKSAR